MGAEVVLKSKEFYCGSRWRQYYSAFAANLAVVSVGTAWSWTATAIPSIHSTSSFVPLTYAEEAWITSVIFLGALVACPFSGYYMQRFGVRASMLTLTCPLVAGWILIIFSTNFWMLFAGRIITGFCAGGVSLAVPVFIAETTEAEIRGKLGFGYDFMGCVGQLYIFVVGYYVSWQWQAVACGIVPIIFHILLLPVPESPRTLISKNKLDKARKSLSWFRHAKTTDLVEEEFNTILEAVEASKTEQSNFQAKDYLSPAIVRPTLIGVMLMFFMQTSGVIPVFAYTVEIFKDAGVDDSYLATVLIGVVQAMVCISAAFVVDRVGRRFLLMFSALFMAINLIILGCYLYWRESISSNWSWIPLTCIVLYVAGFALGIGPVPFVLMGELAPTAAKGLSSAIIILSSRAFAFIVAFLFKYMIDLMGQHGCYWFYATFCILGFCYVYLYVPETKGKSLLEIQQFFARESKGKIRSGP